MINLFENYGSNEILLKTSLDQAGYYNQTIVLNDNGHLPIDILSPTAYFIEQNKKRESSTYSPKFFNDLPIPAYWEIVGDNVQAFIFDGYKKKGVINYCKKTDYFRIIESIEWLNDFGQTRVTDMYNKHGWRFGRKTYSDGEHVLTSYFDEVGHEVILINHRLNIIQVNYKGKHYIFKSFEDYILFYFKVAEINTSKIYYNSLSTPFFITLALQKLNKEINYNHTLFWQEESSELPGNMRYILDDSKQTTKQIVVQDELEFHRINKQLNGHSPVSINFLGYIYKFTKKNTFKPSIFILTNSDEISQISELVLLLSEYKIIIAAKTEMSQKLNMLDVFPNVELYPQITDKEIENLFENGCIYLDINYGAEVENAVFCAFLNNLLIFSFKETAHNNRFVVDKNSVESSKFNDITDVLKDFIIHPSNFEEALLEQQIKAGKASINSYKEILK